MTRLLKGLDLIAEWIGCNMNENHVCQLFELLSTYVCIKMPREFNEMKKI